LRAATRLAGLGGSAKLIGDARTMGNSVHTYVVRLGDALAITLDRETARSAGLKEGDPLEVTVRDDRLILRRARPRYTLEALLTDTTPEDYRAAAVDWGPDQGREAAE
jgi:antitoxin MazE